ncbi:MAG: helix-turn-helix domain-containing protein [Candidatus Omnitrophica bacterium]|nr:helix-turn-helix domain-containing protein [Candidatus Omnitrophota bacterium]
MKMLEVSKNECELMTAGQVAEYLAVSRHTIYQWISDCRIEFPYYKLPRGVRFNRRDVDVWIQSRKVKPVSSY